MRTHPIRVAGATAMLWLLGQASTVHAQLGVLRMNGKPFGTSKAALSADGKTLSVENDFSMSVGGGTVGKSAETWVRK